MLNQPLQQAVARAAGLEAATDLHLVQCSSTGATGAIIFHGWVSGERHPRVVVKTPRDSRLHHALRREWDAVTHLRTDARLTQIIPAALATFTIDRAEYFAYQGAEGRTMYSRFRNRLVASRTAMLGRFAEQALAVIVRVHETSTRHASADEVARDLLLDLAWLEQSIDGFPRSVAEGARARAERLGATRYTLPSGCVHGDFSPYNVLTTSMATDATLNLIDWEHAEADRPQHLDVFRFVSACTLLGLRGQARHLAFQRMAGNASDLLAKLLRPWLARLSVPRASDWLQPSLLEALWWHYWVHAARREQERRARPEDWQDATYLPGLASLAGPHGALAPRCRSSAFAC
jgi:hypothetical protein